MSSLLSKRWAQKAQELELGQLEAFRKTAEQWRNGLVALTALVGTATVVEGPETVADLSVGVRNFAVGASVVALISLAVGSLFAMNAAFGLPGREFLLSGENLRRWELKELKSGHKALRYAKVASIAGVLAIATSTWTVLAAERPEPNQVAVRNSQGMVICGSLNGSDEAAMSLEVSDEFGDPEVVTVSYTEIQEFRLLENCPES